MRATSLIMVVADVCVIIDVIQQKPAQQRTSFCETFCNHLVRACRKFNGQHLLYPGRAPRLGKSIDYKMACMQVVLSLLQDRVRQSVPESDPNGAKKPEALKVPIACSRHFCPSSQ